VSRVADLLDKGSGAVLVTESTIRDKRTNEIYSKTTAKLFIRGLGNFGVRSRFKSNDLSHPYGVGQERSCR